MAETTEGGCYKDATGDGFHDANGKPVPAEKVAEAQRMQREQSQQKLAMAAPAPAQASDVLAALNLLQAAARTPAPAPAQPSSDATGDSAITGGNLTAETERRAKASQK